MSQAGNWATRGWGKAPLLDKVTAKGMGKGEHKYKEVIHCSYGKKRVYLLPGD